MFFKMVLTARILSKINYSILLISIKKVYLSSLLKMIFTFLIPFLNIINLIILKILHKLYWCKIKFVEFGLKLLRSSGWIVRKVRMINQNISMLLLQRILVKGFLYGKINIKWEEFLLINLNQISFLILKIIKKLEILILFSYSSLKIIQSYQWRNSFFQFIKNLRIR